MFGSIKCSKIVKWPEVFETQQEQCFKPTPLMIYNGATLSRMCVSLTLLDDWCFLFQSTAKDYAKQAHEYFQLLCR